MMRPEKPDFEAVYERFYDRLYKYAYTILLNRENAEDVASDTFMAAFFAYDRYDPSLSTPATWLTRIAHNKAVDFARSAAYRREELTEAEEAPLSEDFTEEVETRQLLRGAAFSNPAHKEVLRARLFGDMQALELDDLAMVAGGLATDRFQPEDWPEELKKS